MEIWELNFHDWDLKEERLRETLLTLGNGYFSTRGSGEESISDKFHYAGTYLAGGYNQITSFINDRTILHEDLVNWPDWLCLSFCHVGEDRWFNLSDVKILSYHQKLDLKKGELIRLVHLIDEHARESIIESSRFVSMDNPHVAGIKWNILSKNWSGEIQVRAWINGDVKNLGVNRYKDFNSSHLVNFSKHWPSPEIFVLQSETSQSEIKVIQAIKIAMSREGVKINTDLNPWESGNSVGVTSILPVSQHSKITIEKILSIYTSRDRGCGQAEYESMRLIRRLSSYNDLFKKHSKQWERLWGLCDIELAGLIRETRLLRLHIFHLLQTVSLNTIDLDVGVPARGLHGEAYRGHIFWDEIFILPFLNFRIPELSRSLLMYRFRRLDEARENARINGLSGAMFPWQSASNGEEESQTYHLNPMSGRWMEDATHKQRHINGAVLYNIWQYYQATGDKEFLSQFGIETALEICKFWVSLLKYNEKRDRFEILRIIGPDEFHTKYPSSQDIGIDNNAYTNYLASWSLRSTIDLLLILSEDRQNELLAYLDIKREELSQWHTISSKIFIPIDENEIIQQFEGFEKLETLDFEFYEKKYGNIQRIDRILEAEGLDVNSYKVNKQADVLMLFYLFSTEELVKGFRWLGYSLNESVILKNIHHHLKLSTNGSTLSQIVHSWVLAKYDTDKAWQLFNLSLETDVADIQGGTSSEGIHLGAMAGTVDLVQRCFTGIEISDDVFWIRPRLPKMIGSIQMLLHFRGHSFEVTASNKNVKVKVKRSWRQSGKLGVHDKIVEFKQGDEFNIDL